LVLWFFGRFKAQQIVDAVHLQQLLDGVIAKLYQTHRHRALKMPPEQALAGRTSPRMVPPPRLYEAFMAEVRKKAHKKTGEVELGSKTYLVPDDLCGQRLTFFVDPTGHIPPSVKLPHSDQRVPISVAQVTPADAAQRSDDTAGEGPRRWGEGPLQALYDSFAGKHRPLAQPGFGLPELYQLLSDVSGRHVPETDAEAATIQRAYQSLGPLPKQATSAAFAQIKAELGSARPMRTYLAALKRRVTAQAQKAAHQAQQEQDDPLTKGQTL
jgi:hypothetical protein